MYPALENITYEIQCRSRSINGAVARPQDKTGLSSEERNDAFKHRPKLMTGPSCPLVL